MYRYLMAWLTTCPVDGCKTVHHRDPGLLLSLVVVAAVSSDDEHIPEYHVGAGSSPSISKSEKQGGEKMSKQFEMLPLHLSLVPVVLPPMSIDVCDSIEMLLSSLMPGGIEQPVCSVQLNG